MINESLHFSITYVQVDGWKIMWILRNDHVSIIKLLSYWSTYTDNILIKYKRLFIQYN